MTMLLMLLIQLKSCHDCQNRYREEFADREPIGDGKKQNVAAKGNTPREQKIGK